MTLSDIGRQPEDARIGESQVPQCGEGGDAVGQLSVRNTMYIDGFECMQPIDACRKINKCGRW